jgi:hypothetical protein
MQSSQAALATAPQPLRMAICWLDVFLLSGTLLLGLILWALAGRYITWRHRLEVPQKESYEQTAQLPKRNAELSMAQDDLKASQTKLFEQEMEASRLTARIQEIKTSPPAANGNTANATDPTRDDRVALAIANAMVQDLKKGKPAKLQRVADTARSAFDSRHEAEMAYTQAMEHFELRKRFQTVLLGTASWALLFLVSWFVCGVLHRKVGRGRRPVVLLPALLVFLLVCAFEFLR